MSAAGGGEKNGTAADQSDCFEVPENAELDANEEDNVEINDVEEHVHLAVCDGEFLPMDTIGNASGAIAGPVEGMTFETVNHAKQYYSKYAKDIGFDICVRDSKYIGEGNYSYVMYACSRGGLVRRSTKKVHSLRPTSKVNCRACMVVRYSENKYVVRKVVLEHCHELSPSKGSRIQSNKNIGVAARKRLKLNEKADISPIKNYNCLVDEVGDRGECSEVSKNVDLEVNGEDNVEINGVEEEVELAVCDGECVPTDTTIDASSAIAEPTEGMTFETVTHAKQYYLKYAKNIGFRICVRDSRYSGEGNYTYVMYACSRSGSVRRSTKKVHRLRPSFKVNCQACMAVRYYENKYVVRKVVLEHCHELSPNKGPCFQSNKNIGVGARKRFRSNERANIHPTKNYNCLVGEASGCEEMTINEKDCRNNLQKKRGKSLSCGDGVAVMEYFSKCMKDDNSFYYMVDFNEEGRIKSLIWVDGRARAVYKDFGDVISFDTTYMTNAYDIPFVLFVGVNHHGKSIILGSGLLVNETVASFVWFFRSWLNCMGGIAPKAIITDQCQAIRDAIKIVFPGVRHRICQFHISSKLNEKLGTHAHYEAIKILFNDIVYKSQTREEFEEAWHRMVASYNLQSNIWLNDLYSGREMWVPVFVKKCFWAGLSSTQQRCEGINFFFGEYVNSSTCLRNLLEQYGSAMAKIAEDEAECDFHSLTDEIKCISDLVIEKQFQKAYTHAKFTEFQQQLMKSIGRIPKLLSNDAGKRSYVVREKLFGHGSMRQVDYCVDFEEETSYVNCSCMLFQSQGILCAHAIIVLSCEGMEEVHSMYILDRWRKDVKRMHTYVKCAYTPPALRASIETYDEFLKYFDDFMHEASGNPDRLNYLRYCFKELRSRVAQIV